MPDEQDAGMPEGASPNDGMPAGGESAAEPAAAGPPESGESDDFAAAALKAAQDAVSAINTEAMSPGGAQPVGDGGPMPFEAPGLSQDDFAAAPKGLDLLSDVNVHVTIELGRTRMLVEDVLRLSEGSVVELDKLAGDPVDVFVNERLVARGEVLVLNDNFCVRVNEILDADKAEDI